MANYPSIEALEGSHTFPGPYTLKVFGVHEQHFIDSVHREVRNVLNEEARYDTALRPSSKGTYCAVHLDVQAKSAEEVQALYVALSDIEGLKTLL